MRIFETIAFTLLFASACRPPHRDLPPDAIDKLESLKKVMDVQATVADPQFKRANASNFDETDWAAFADMGSRLQVTSRKTKQFSRGPGFDALADQLGTQASALSAAAAAKKGPDAAAALKQIKATCKECHSKFR